MKYISINSIGDFPEDFLIAKVDIERLLLETGAIEQRMKLEDFIVYLNIQETIYMKNQKSVAFRIIKGETDTYVFYSTLDEEEGLIESFKSKLEDMKYDLSGLKKVEPMELLQMDLSNTEMFMINFVLHK